MHDFDFIAELQFLTIEESGRKSAAKSGYRPHIEFENYPEYLTSGHQVYIDKEEEFPGEKVQAKIIIVGTEYFSKRLFKGKKFKFCEGSRTIGFGEIIKILNSKLAKDESEQESEFNLNLFPKDILARIEIDFGDETAAVARELQKYLIENKYTRNPRLIRSIIYLANKSKEKLIEEIKNAKVDWRDVLFSAEYENKSSSKPIRVRDFNRKFGNDNIL